MKLFHKRTLCLCQSLMNKIEIRYIICVFSNKQVLNHKLQSFLWWLLFGTTDTVSKLKCFIHHLLRSTVKISSSAISSGASSACPVGLTLRSAANYLPLFCKGAKVGKKNPNNEKCSAKQHSYNKTFLCSHALKDMFVNNFPNMTY